jgi:para-nitrobenzyl esterase
MEKSKISIAALMFIATISLGLIFSFRQINELSFDTIKVEGGIISGTTNAGGDVHVFKGIPFAAPPLGNLRWKEPQPVIPWNGVKKCDSFGPSPMQGTPNPFGPWSAEFLIPKEPISEDCLYLNVWTGAKKTSDKKPVIVYIYGGGFGSGGAGCAIYDGEAMAKKGVIFVSINYRVGIFGFFAHPDLTKESSHNASGNYGIMDQIASLRWVQKNIAAFGGDPNNVTIAGQSAGSVSVNCLVASSLGKDLFKHAIAESGAAFARNGRAISLKTAEEDGLKIGASITDLRAMSAADLMKKPQTIRGLIIDGYVLPQSIPDIFAAGRQNDVALLTGWNKDDGIAFAKPINTIEEYKKQVAQQYGADSAKFFALYPANSNEEAVAAQGDVSRDMIFGCANYTWARIQAEKSKQKVFLYYFTRKLPATVEYVKFGAFHTGEVPYAYDNLSFVNRCPWEPVDHQLATIMSSYWANFATSGNPNGKGLPEWPAYNTKDYMTMILGETQEAKTLPNKAGIDFLLSKMK